MYTLYHFLCTSIQDGRRKNSIGYDVLVTTRRPLHRMLNMIILYSVAW